MGSYMAKGLSLRVRLLDLNQTAVPANGSAALARSRGIVRLSFKKTGESTVFDTLYQAGCLRIRMPRPEPRASPEAIVINIAGGLTGGDEIDLAARWGHETCACLCSQAAEKIYRSTGAVARVSNNLTIDANANAEWLPQETILFDHAALDRRLEVHVARGAHFIGADSIVFGRTAMGEEVVSGFIRDTWRIRRERRLIYADSFRLDGDVAAKLDRTAIGAAARAFGIILLVAECIAQDVLEKLRATFADAAGRAAASLWDGVLAARFLARDGESLKHDMMLALSVLRNSRKLPRVWQC